MGLKTKLPLFFLLFLMLWNHVETFEVIKSQDNFKVGNFVKLGDEQVLRKNDSLLSKKATSSHEECCFLCVDEPSCLSVNVILQSSSSFVCELFNWTTDTNVTGLLVQIKNSFRYALQVVR